MKKINKNKIGKGLVSLLAIIILMSSILAGTFYYQNSITANVIKEASIIDEPAIQVKEVKDINELNYLNEGFYEIRNGFVLYLETFDSSVPLWIEVKNPEQKNGMFSVDEDGAIRFNKSFEGLAEQQAIEQESVQPTEIKSSTEAEKESTQNKVT